MLGPKWKRAAALSTNVHRPPEWEKGGWQEDNDDSLESLVPRSSRAGHNSRRGSYAVVLLESCSYYSGSEREREDAFVVTSRRDEDEEARLGGSSSVPGSGSVAGAEYTRVT